MQTMKRFLADDRGLETVEYAIITGLIVTGLIAVVAAIGTWIKGKFDALKTTTGA
jgi:Flp pilus assembly pilin Flp